MIYALCIVMHINIKYHILFFKKKEAIFKYLRNYFTFLLRSLLHLQCNKDLKTKLTNNRLIIISWMVHAINVVKLL